MNIKSQSGFTLLEMIVVIALLGILMVVGLPNFTDVIETAEATQVRMEIMQARVKVETYLADRIHWDDGSEIADYINERLQNDIVFSWSSEEDKEYILAHPREFGDKQYEYDSYHNEITFSD